MAKKNTLFLALSNNTSWVTKNWFSRKKALFSPKQKKVQNLSTEVGSVLN